MLKKVSSIENELEQIGFDSGYLKIAENKFRYANIKIFDLSIAQANILKQTALIFGADCAVNRNVITGNIKKSDAILCGSYRQLEKIANNHLKDWTIDRLGKTDKAILRLGAYELIHYDTPKVVVINEAVELAKKYSDDKVVKLINAVLDKIRDNEVIDE